MKTTSELLSQFILTANCQGSPQAFLELEGISRMIFLAGIIGNEAGNFQEYEKQ